MTFRKTAVATSLLSLCALLVTAQDKKAEPKETIAIINVRILPVSGPEIKKGTILIQDGKIAAVGKSVKVPDGAEVIDAKGMTAMPGLVNPYSRLGATVSGRGTRSLPHYLAYDEFNPAVETFTRISRSGYTSFAVYPTHGTISGRAVLVKPLGLTKETMIAEKMTYLRMDMQLGTSTKKLLKKEFAAASKLVEAEKKRLADEKKKKDAEKNKKPAPKKPGEKNPPPKRQPPPKQDPSKKKPPARKPDEKSIAMRDYFLGKFPAIVEINSPAELLHFWQCLKEVDALNPIYAIRTSGGIYKAADKVGKRKLMVVIPPSLTLEQYTMNRVNPPAELADGGARIAFVPFSDSVRAHEEMFTRTAELVKYGLKRDHALKALTLHPAQAAGVAKRVGSLEKGKDADILLLSGDPFDPMTHVEKILINGEVVHERSNP